MKSRFLLIAACSILFSCGNTPKTNVQKEQIITGQEANLSTPASAQKQFFTIESARIKYRNTAAGQETFREWWFDQHGNRQYEENYMVIVGQKSGSKSLILDGIKYMWNMDSSTGTKSKYYQAVTDYDKVSEREIQRYGIQKHGYEEVSGKKCLKVTTEKPAKSTTWVWNNIPLKTEAVFAGNAVTMEALEISTGNVDAKIFELPADVTFSEAN